MKNVLLFNTSKLKINAKPQEKSDESSKSSKLYMYIYIYI